MFPILVSKCIELQKISWVPMLDVLAMMGYLCISFLYELLYFCLNFVSTKP